MPIWRVSAGTRRARSQTHRTHWRRRIVRGLQHTITLESSSSLELSVSGSPWELIGSKGGDGGKAAMRVAHAQRRRGSSAD
eukprot:5187981-Prymnesium_polylepis.2